MPCLQSDCFPKIKMENRMGYECCATTTELRRLATARLLAREPPAWVEHATSAWRNPAVQITTLLKLSYKDVGEMNPSHRTYNTIYVSNLVDS